MLARMDSEDGRRALPRHEPRRDRTLHSGRPPRPGVLATVRADGRPHVAPVWVDLDEDGSIVFTTGEGTVKGRNLRRSGRAALLHRRRSTAVLLRRHWKAR